MPKKLVEAAVLELSEQASNTRNEINSKVGFPSRLRHLHISNKPHEFYYNTCIIMAQPNYCHLPTREEARWSRPFGAQVDEAKRLRGAGDTAGAQACSELLTPSPTLMVPLALNKEEAGVERRLTGSQLGSRIGQGPQGSVPEHYRRGL